MADKGGALQGDERVGPCQDGEPGCSHWIVVSHERSLSLVSSLSCSPAFAGSEQIQQYKYQYHILVQVGRGYDRV